MLRTLAPLIGALGVPRTAMQITRRKILYFVAAAGLAQAGVSFLLSQDEAVPGLESYLAKNSQVVAMVGPDPQVKVRKATYLEGNPDDESQPKERIYRVSVSGPVASATASVKATRENNSDKWLYILDSLDR